jgi:hypothetical protein
MNLDQVFSGEKNCKFYNIFYKKIDFSVWINIILFSFFLIMSSDFPVICTIVPTVRIRNLKHI